MSANHRLASATVATAVLALGIVAGPPLGGAASATETAGLATVAVGATVTEPPYDRGIVIEIPRDASSTVDLMRVFGAGAIFSVALYENGSTGYTWSSALSAGSEQFVTFLDTDLVPDQVPPGTVGAGGTRYFRYRADRCGRAVLTLRYQRPWEPDPIQQVTLTVLVR